MGPGMGSRGPRECDRGAAVSAARLGVGPNNAAAAARATREAEWVAVASPAVCASPSLACAVPCGWSAAEVGSTAADDEHAAGACIAAAAAGVSAATCMQKTASSLFVGDGIAAWALSLAPGVSTSGSLPSHAVRPGLMTTAVSIAGGATGLAMSCGSPTAMTGVTCMQHGTRDQEQTDVVSVTDFPCCVSAQACQAAGAPIACRGAMAEPVQLQLDSVCMWLGAHTNVPAPPHHACSNDPMWRSTMQACSLHAVCSLTCVLVALLAVFKGPPKANVAPAASTPPSKISTSASARPSTPATTAAVPVAVPAQEAC